MALTLALQFENRMNRKSNLILSLILTFPCFSHTTTIASVIRLTQQLIQGFLSLAASSPPLRSSIAEHYTDNLNEIMRDTLAVHLL